MVRKSIYCGGPTIELGNWLRAPQPFPEGAATWPQLEGRTVVGTHRGRTAIALACRLLGLREGHEILVPSYNCGTELDAIRDSGATLVGYNVSRQCEIDLNDLVAKKTNRTRAIYLIHYFGWDQPMAELRSWCDDHELLIIEDCALALFSSGQSGSIGRTGDAAIYSFPKTLGMVHGGMLSLASEPRAGLPRLKPSGTMTWLNEIRHSAKSMALRDLEKLGVSGQLVSAHRRRKSERAVSADADKTPDMPSTYYFDSKLEANRALHPMAAAIIESLSWQQVVHSRRDNYLRLAGILGRMRGAEPLFTQLPSGVCPLSFPLIVPNRDQCVRQLQSRGIVAIPWWAGFHRDGLDWSRFPDACWLKHNLLTIPVYQGISTRQLEEMAAIVRDVME